MQLRADEGFFTCDFCGSVHVPDANADGVRILEQRGAQVCPICPVPLVEAAVDSQRILYCPHCRGMLIRMGVFRSVIQDLRSRREAPTNTVFPLERKELDRRIHCPMCSQEMNTHVYGAGGNVVVSTCESCEVIWLDYGELDRIVRAPDHTYSSL